MARITTIALTVALWTLATGVHGAQHHETSDALSIAGRWIVSGQGPHAVSIALTLEQYGTKLTGTLANPHGGSDFPIAGTFADRKFAFAVTSGSDMEFAGELKEDGTLAGTLSSARGDLDWTAKRVDKQ